MFGRNNLVGYGLALHQLFRGDEMQDFYDYVYQTGDSLLSVTFIENHYVIVVNPSNTDMEGMPVAIELKLDYMTIKDMVITLLAVGFDRYESFFYNNSITSLDEMLLIIDYTERRTRNRVFDVNRV